MLDSVLQDEYSYFFIDPNRNIGRIAEVTVLYSASGHQPYALSFLFLFAVSH